MRFGFFFFIVIIKTNRRPAVLTIRNGPYRTLDSAGLAAQVAVVPTQPDVFDRPSVIERAEQSRAMRSSGEKKRVEKR